MEYVVSRYTHQICDAAVLIIVNKNFHHHEYRSGADADRKNVQEFCKNAGFTVCNTTHVEGLKRDDLTAEEMEDLFKTISKQGDFSSYDAFICFISSYGDSEGILGVDGDIITPKEIVRCFKGCPSLVGKPKLFFIQSCRGFKKDSGVSKPSKMVADHGFAPIGIAIPSEADILVAYSSLDGYESYKHKEKGSWFITVLMKVLNEYAHNMNLTDMLAIVNAMVASMEYCGRKQMPFFMSTLRKAVCFKLSEPPKPQGEL